MGSIKLYLDEDLSDTLARVLRGKDFDVTSSHEVGLNGSLDEDQLDYAVKENRAILTFNVADFADLHQNWSDQNKIHFGIIVSPQLDLKRMIKFVSNLLQQKTEEEIKNEFIWLQNYR